MVVWLDTIVLLHSYCRHDTYWILVDFIMAASDYRDCTNICIRNWYFDTVFYHTANPCEFIEYTFSESKSESYCVALLCGNRTACFTERESHSTDFFFFFFIVSCIGALNTSGSDGVTFRKIIGEIGAKWNMGTKWNTGCLEKKC